MKGHVVSPVRHAERDFRELLRDELARRCERNPKYSLRAFAEDLGTDHSSLSQLLRGRRRPTEASIRALGRGLGLAGDVLDAHVARASRVSETGDTGERLRVVRDLTEDVLEVLRSDLHHALLELTRLESFRADVRWIARVLGVDTDEVAVAVQRLLRLGMLRMNEGGDWEDVTGDETTVFEGRAYDAVRRLAASLPPDERAARHGGEVSTTTLAIDGRRLPEALERLASCRRSLLSSLSEGTEHDTVVRLSLELVPLTRTDPRPTDEEDGCPAP